MWCWGKMEKISLTDSVRNEEVLYRVKEERNILHKMKRRINYTGNISRRNCLLKHITERKVKEGIEVKDDKEEDVNSYWISLRKREGT